MELFQKEKFGKTISQELSNYLRQYTGVQERTYVSSLTGVGTSTIRDVVFKSNTLTETNVRALKELSKLAVQNSLKKIPSSVKVQKKIISELEL